MGNKKTTKPDLIIYDMDGTLTEHVEDGYGWVRFFERLGIDILSFVSSTRDKLRQEKGLLGLRFDEARLLSSPLIQRMGKLRDGLKPFLAAQQQQDIKQIIYSNAPGAGYGHDVLKANGLHRFFDAVFFREDMRALKPDISSLASFIIENGLEAGYIAFYGNEETDDLSARALQSQFPEASISYHHVDQCFTRQGPQQRRSAHIKGAHG